MKISTVKLIYFSPTGTTQTTLNGIAQGIGAGNVESINLTVPDEKTISMVNDNGQLVIFGAPVYGGRLPGVAAARLKKIIGDGIPAVVVVVYGNRDYDNALFELKAISQDNGFVPIAAGAFIGQHTFTSDETPIAVGRPDEEDIQKAVAFGKSVREKLASIQSVGDILPVEVPGEMPPEEGRESTAQPPEINEDLCNMCGICAEVCPTSAIKITEKVQADDKLCIMCCACAKNCPTEAMTVTSPRIKAIAKWLSENCSTRKEPETFFKSK